MKSILGQLQRDQIVERTDPVDVITSSGPAKIKNSLKCYHRLCKVLLLSKTDILQLSGTVKRTLMCEDILTRVSLDSIQLLIQLGDNS